MEFIKFFEEQATKVIVNMIEEDRLYNIVDEDTADFINKYVKTLNNVIYELERLSTYIDDDKLITSVQDTEWLIRKLAEHVNKHEADHMVEDIIEANRVDDDE